MRKGLRHQEPSAVMGAFKARGIERTAMRAERTIGPLDSFQMLAGCVLIVEAR